MTDNTQQQDQQDQGMTDDELGKLLDSGELPDDPHEIERLLGYDSDDKGQYADGDEVPGDETSANTPTKQDDTSTGDGEGGNGDGNEPGEQPGDKVSADDTDPPAGDDKGEPSGLEDANADKGDNTANDDKPDDDTQPKGVATRNGQHIIPYGVLESTRRQLSEAEKRAQEVAERNKQLETELQQLRTSPPRTDQAVQGAQDQLDQAETQQQNLFNRLGIDAKDLPLNDDGTLDVNALAEEYDPQIVNIIAAQNKLVSKLADQVDTLRETSDRLQQREQQLLQDSVQDAIDATPQLASIQAEGGRRWDIAKSIDRDLREDPEWQHAPMRVRFTEVAHLLSGGAPRTPTEAEAALQGSPAPKPAAANRQTTGNPQDRAAQRLRQEAQRSAPHTHTDLPAGERPAQRGADRLEDMDVTDLEQAFESADDPDEVINRFLR